MVSASTILVDGYNNVNLIYGASGVSAYSGIQNNSEKAVFLKCYEKLSESNLKELGNRFEIFHTLSSSYMTKVIDFVELKNMGQESRIFIYEAAAGVSLNRYLNQRKLPIEKVVEIGIHLSQAIADFHAAGLIHGGVRPTAIMITPQDQKIKISDFEFLIPNNFISYDFTHSNAISDILPYISPEQTGKTKQSIDFRTDLYTLGIILYECLTGMPPFLSDQPQKLIHAHLAQDPPNFSKIDKKIPKTLLIIIFKLLSKAPEDRYIGAWGIKADLKRFLKQWRESSHVSPFKLAQKDVPYVLTIPQKLYGRESEFKKLINVYERIRRGNSELMLISGTSGIGKSILVNELKDYLLTSMDGYFISGKFDQMKRNIPYAPLIQALDELIKQILSESEDQISVWRKRLLKALGPNSQVVIDVLPELEMIIGKQSEVPELGPVESQNRFNFVLGNLIRAISTRDHPLILFLDDLQWADTSSLKMIEVFMSAETSHLFMIGAFRNNEVNAIHPLTMTIKQIRKNDGIVDEIVLSPLEQSHVNQLLYETMMCSSKKSTELARICIEKTRGNPFFLILFIKSLYRQNLIKFDNTMGNWKWDTDQISRFPNTENVIDYMVEEISRLSPQVQKVLKLAACIGNKFDLTILVNINQKSLEETLEQLEEALDKEFILLLEHKQNPSFKFLHDRVHQAVYSYIDGTEKAKTHLHIGRLLLRNVSESQLNEYIFDIVYQLNLATSLINSPQEKEELAELNLVAANKAKASTAFGPAFDYLTSGMRLLEKDCWKKQYTLTRALNEMAAEIAYLNGHFDKTYHLADRVFKNAENILDTVPAYEAKIRAYAMENKFPESLASGIFIIEKLGITFPKKTTDFHILINVLKTKLALWGKKPEDILNREKTRDPQILSMMRILKALGTSAYLADPKLMVVLCLKGFYLMLKNGPSSEAHFCENYGIVLCLIGDIDNGYRYGQLGIELMEKLDFKISKSEVMLNFNSFIRHWKEHIKEGLSPLLSAYQKALETGNLEFAGYSSLMYCINSYFCGKHLGTLESELKKYGRFMGQINQDTSLQYNAIFHQTILNLMGKNDNPIQLTGDYYNEEKMLQVHFEAKDESALFDVHFHKLVLCYLFEEHKKASKYAKLAEKYSDVVLAQPETPLFHFYESLNCLATYTGAGKPKRKLILQKVARNQKKMKKWAYHAPMNCQHKYDLVQAERYRIQRKNAEAMDLYDKAITKANENEYIQEEALGNELAAKFYLAQNKDTIASAYMHKAYGCYLKWGAHAKVKQLKTTYSQLLQDTTVLFNSENWNYDNIQKKHRITGDWADLATVIQAVKTISGEKAPGKLLSRLMKIVIENAGARKGYLILKREEQFEIESRISVNEDNSLKFPKRVEDCKDLCSSIANYTIRTGKDVLINDAMGQGPFKGDPYIKEKQVKSILCMPISDQGRMTGILYLENSQISGAFTPERVKILRTVGEIIATAWARLEAEENLLTHHAQLQSLSSQILLTEEQERRRIAVDLHDRIGHALSNIMLNLGALKQPLPVLEKNVIINEIKFIVEQCIEDTHSLTFEISPPILYDLGLEAALDWLSEQTQTKHNIMIQFKDDEQEKPLDDTMRVLLFQSSRELLFNMVKHSQASSATVSIERMNQDIIIKIEDDGIGFDPRQERYRKKKNGGFGLFSIQERLAQQKGTIEIDSRPGYGTRIKMVSPMQTSEANHL